MTPQDGVPLRISIDPLLDGEVVMNAQCGDTGFTLSLPADKAEAVGLLLLDAASKARRGVEVPS